MKRPLLIAAVFIATVIALSAGRAEGPSGPRYNEVRWKASHNSYAKDRDVMTQLADFNIRSIEFDIHTEKRKLFKPADKAPDRDFLVFHNANDDFSNCRLLSECFGTVRAFHDRRPDHAVITIFFDMQGVGEPGHTVDDLYALFRRELPEGSILTPGDLMSACPAAKTLQESVTAPGCGWPLLDDLKGKFILVVSDGREAFMDAGYDLHKDLLFMVTKSADKSRMSEDPDIVFFNMSGPNPMARTVRDAGFVSRCYWLDTEKKYLKAKANGANHLATDRIDPVKYPWSNISSDSGPFEEIE